MHAERGGERVTGKIKGGSGGFKGEKRVCFRSVGLVLNSYIYSQRTLYGPLILMS